MVEAAISGSALILLLLAVRAVFKKHLTSRFRCALWALALLRLLLPIPLMPSPFSLMNALPQPAAAPAQGPSYVYVSPSALPAPAEGGRVRLVFAGIYKNARIWVNSYYLGMWPYGYSEICLDITDFACFGETENVVV